MGSSKVVAVAVFFLAAAGAAGAQDGWCTLPLPDSLSLPPSHRLHLPASPAPALPELSWRARLEADLDAEIHAIWREGGATRSDSLGAGPLDCVFGVPDWVIRGVIWGVKGLTGSSDAISLRCESDIAMIPRLLREVECEDSPRPFRDFVSDLAVRERKYLDRFQDSDLSTVGFEAGMEPVDLEEFLEDQRKLLLDSARRVYFGRVGTRMDDRVRDQLFDVGSWHPVDFIVGPVVAAGYLYLRGWDKRFRIGPLECRLEIEPFRRIIEEAGDREAAVISAASLELGPRGFPVKLIVSGGVYGGDAELDFIGIGTSVGKVRQVLKDEWRESLVAAR